jgi:hypothetical protein
MPIAAFVLLLSTPLVTLLLHCLACRLPFTRSAPIQVVAARCCAITAIAISTGVIIWSWPVAPHPTSLVLFTFLVSAGSSHVYFHIFNMSETARRIRILVLASTKRDVDVKLGQDRFTQLQMIRRRITRLVSAGIIFQVDGKYHARRTLLMTIAVMMSRYERFLFPQRNSEQRLGKKEPGGQFVNRITRSRL